MKRNAVIALIAGLGGGMVSRYVAPPTAYAQNQPTATTPTEIRARSFTLVDQTDRRVGTFSVEPLPRQFRNFGPVGYRIVLRDSAGREILGRWRLGTGTIKHAIGSK